MRKLLVCLAALPLLVAGPVGADDDPDIFPGELALLAQVLAAELEDSDLQRVEVGRQLRTRRDSGAARAAALARLPEQLPGVTAELVAAFVERNRDRVDLWPAARRRLGQRAERNAFLVAEPREVHAQFARAARDARGERALVYLELRPFEGALELEGIFRLFERRDGRWQLTSNRTAFGDRSAAPR